MDWQNKFDSQFERVPITPQANGHDRRRMPDTSDTELRIMTLSSVKTEKLIPLWPGRLWCGKTSLMAGDPGLGKSLVTLDIAARITTGREWPASIERAPVGDVVLLSAEDDAADTLRPRLEAAGADLSRVHAVTEVIERDPRTNERRRKTFRLGAHLEYLEKICAERKPLLLVIDPITAYMSADTDAHATADVRSDLAPLAEMAQAHGVAVLMVSHLNKATSMQAIYRVTGSVAFVAAARSAFGVVRDPADRERRYFLPLKNNLGKDSGGLAYRIDFNGQAPYLTWDTEPVDVDIDMLAVSSPREKAKQATENAVSVWLRDLLQHGPVAAATLWRRAEQAGHSERKVKAALRSLGVKGAPAGFRQAWHYALSADLTDSDIPPRHVNLPDSDPLCGFPANSAESGAIHTSDSGSFSGDRQTRTESDTLTSPAEVRNCGG